MSHLRWTMLVKLVRRRRRKPKIRWRLGWRRCVAKYRVFHITCRGDGVGGGVARPHELPKPQLPPVREHPALFPRELEPEALARVLYTNNRALPSKP